MADNLVKFSATIAFRFNTSSADRSYYKCYARITDTGNTGLRPGDTVIVFGHSDMYIEKGLNLIMSGEFQKVDTYREPMNVYKIYEIWPDKDRKALIRFLSSSKFKGIGQVKARDIVETLGLRCLELIREHPECLERVKSLDAAMRQEIADHIDGTDIDNTIRDICPSVSQKFLNYMNEEHAKDGMMIIRTDPYVLLDERDKCSAIKFDLIDLIGRTLGVGMTSLHRIRYCVRDVVHELAEKGVRGLTMGGNVYIPISDQRIWTYFYQEVSKRLNIDWQIVDKAIADGTAGVTFVSTPVMNAEPAVRCYLNDRLKDEMDAGMILRNAAMSETPVMKAGMAEIRNALLDYNANYCSGGLVQEQMMALMTAMTHKVSVLTGIPGSGKSTVVAGIAYMWRKLFECDGMSRAGFPGSVSMAAPTGKAVRRMNECVAGVKPAGWTNMDKSQGYVESYESYWESRTIASYIYSYKKGNSTLETELKRRNNGVNRLVIIDETSMVGIEDFAAFLRLFPDAHFVFVGDTEQLPAISPGEVLQNLCETGVIPVSQLTINHRSKTAMALGDNRALIHDGNVNLITDPGVFDVKYFYQEDPAMLDFVIQTYFDELGAVGDISELSMIVPRNSKGLCCVAHLNSIIRDRLNPVVLSGQGNQSMADRIVLKAPGNEVPCLVHRDEIDKKNYRMRIGDRVVITKNNIAAPVTGSKDGDASVVNGDMGYIREYDCIRPGARNEEHMVIIELDDGRRVSVDDTGLKYIELGYATTVHKAQGCEYKSVIFVAQGNMTWGQDFANRNLIYTAVTRAKRHCWVIGLKPSVEYCIRTVRPRRNSMLAYRIAGLM